MPEDVFASVILDPDAQVCSRDGCQRADSLVAIDPDGPENERRTVCPDHLVEYLQKVRA